MRLPRWVIICETEEGVVVPRFKVHGPYNSWQDASNANGVHNGEISPLPVVLDDRKMVRCDSGCGAFMTPEGTKELRAAVEHWQLHITDQGCSHGC